MGSQHPGEWLFYNTHKHNRNIFLSEIYQGQSPEILGRSCSLAAWPCLQEKSDL